MVLFKSQPKSTILILCQLLMILQNNLVISQPLPCIYFITKLNHIHPVLYWYWKKYSWQPMFAIHIISPYFASLAARAISKRNVSLFNGLIIVKKWRYFCFSSYNMRLPVKKCFLEFFAQNFDAQTMKYH